MTFGIPWRTWEPIYEAILSDFGFPREADERARDELVSLLDGQGLSPGELPDARNAAVAVVGDGPTLRDEVDRAVDADLVFLASTRTELVRQAGAPIDLHVTDLDTDNLVVNELLEAGVPVAIHAHGDNREILTEFLPSVPHEPVFPTTQARPVAGIYNPGGFTDGDRAAFLADALGARTLTFPGWSFDDPAVHKSKRQKLRWAERLLFWLERRRGERFDVLDGRRDAISLPTVFDASRGD